MLLLYHIILFFITTSHLICRERIRTEIVPVIMIAIASFTGCPCFPPEHSVITSLYLLLKRWNSSAVIDLQPN